MTDILPPINTSGSNLFSYGSIPIQFNIPSDKNKSSKYQKGALQFRNVTSHKSEISHKSRTKTVHDPAQNKLKIQTSLSQDEINQYRNCYKHNMLVKMLENGFHKSYAEIFNLIEKDKTLREEASRNSSQPPQPPLEDQHQKLEIMVEYLSASELVSREKDFTEVALWQCKLMEHFNTPEDKWLSLHFYTQSVKAACKVGGDEGKMLAKCHYKRARTCEEDGNDFEAASQFSIFYEFTKDKDGWEFENGVSMYGTACDSLNKIHTKIASKYEAQNDLDNYLVSTKQAYEIAKKGANVEMLADAIFKMGDAYSKHNDFNTALKYFEQFLEMSSKSQNEQTLGRAYEAIARCYESQSNTEEASKYLEMFMENSKKSKDEDAISRSCSALGSLFNKLHKYDEAEDYYKKSFEIAQGLVNEAKIDNSRVNYGIAAGHKMMRDLTMNHDFVTKSVEQNLIEWKDNRSNNFKK